MVLLTGIMIAEGETQEMTQVLLPHGLYRYISQHYLCHQDE